MLRKIIEINEEKCNGCGACALACHEDAIGMVNGKATLLRDDYCDGLGDCLPTCPTGAITFVVREADEYNEAEVKQNQAKKSKLTHWPVQLKLAPVTAPYYQRANLLIAADCTAYAYGDFQNQFMKDRITLIGCPKLDQVDYSEKLTEILKNNDIASVTVVRMEVPCCGGIEFAVNNSLQQCGKRIPSQIVVLTTDGKIK